MRAAIIALVLIGLLMVLEMNATTYSSSDAEADVLARTIWGEARGEGYDGMVAVGNVIRNRALSGSSLWPSTISAVCLQRKQFSCWLPSDPNYQKLTTVTTADASFAEALEIARGIIAGSLSDNTAGATYYFNPAIVQPSWAAALRNTLKIGAHLFGSM